MPILECNQLSKSYGKVPALDGVSFAIEPGRIVGLLGPNGSGKTTLIKLANGLLTPSSGEILIDGRTPGRETHAMVSYLPERTAIPTWMSAGQLMDFYEDFYPDFRRQAAEEMLHHLNIQPKQRIKQMSKGTREKVQLIMVMSRAARLYLLDEPENSLSPMRQMELTEYIENAARFFHCQFVISTHSPFLLSLSGAKIYDLDSDPVDVRRWTELENVRTYYDFFKKHEREFSDE